MVFSKGFEMKNFVYACLVAFCSWVQGCDISIKIVFDAPKGQPQPQREPTKEDVEIPHYFRWIEGMGEKPPAPPKRFYNPATAEDYDQAHRYLERNPEKPARKPQSKKPWETELYGPS
jgi:hypothetical protein